MANSRYDVGKNYVTFQPAYREKYAERAARLNGREVGYITLDLFKQYWIFISDTGHEITGDMQRHVAEGIIAHYCDMSH
jgi:hypothetical protein